MTVRNTDRLISKLSKLPIAARSGIGKALATSVVELDAYAKEKIQGGSRSGRIYQRRGVSHRASAPGEFPKADRGGLAPTLFKAVGADKLRAWFGSKLNYAAFLEFGTSRMEARPWLRPTFKANEKSIRERIRAAVREAFRG
jgi:HK97 gp10 family phage protein